MSCLTNILNVFTHSVFGAQSLTHDKKNDNPSLAKRVADVMLNTFISQLTVCFSSTFCFNKARWKHLTPTPSQSTHPKETERKNPMASANSIDSIEFTLSPKRELKVTELASDEETLKKIAKVARQWQDLAREKLPKCDSTWLPVMDDLRTISKLIAECMERPEETAWIWNKIIVCEDVALKEIQAIALVCDVYPRMVKIAHIATHPRNVRSSVNLNDRETTRVEGAAKAIVNYLVTSPLVTGKEIYAESVWSAKPFYIKMGFEELDPKEHPTIEWGTIPMSLPAQKIQSMNSKAA